MSFELKVLKMAMNVFSNGGGLYKVTYDGFNPSSVANAVANVIGSFGHSVRLIEVDDDGLYLEVIMNEESI